MYLDKADCARASMILPDFIYVVRELFMKIFRFRPLLLLASVSFTFTSPSHAQEFIQVSDRYTCIKFANGTSTVALNGAGIGEYALVGAGPALKDIRAEKRALNQKISLLKETRVKVQNNEFTKKAPGWFQRFLDHYLPTEQFQKKKRERIAQIDRIILKVRGEISSLKAIDLAISQCSQAEQPDKSVAKYGQRIPVVVKPVIVPGSAASNFREAYVGMLISVPQDVNINDDQGRKIGTRSGYLACAKNLSTGKTFYRIFDDQPCEEAEGGPSGGNTSLPFADLAACKALVPTGSWASFGYWQALDGYPTQETVNNAYANLLATIPPFFLVVFYDADPYGSSGATLDEFKSWCSSGNAF